MSFSQVRMSRPSPLFGSRSGLNTFAGYWGDRSVIGCHWLPIDIQALKLVSIYFALQYHIIVCFAVLYHTVLYYNTSLNYTMLYYTV